MDMSRPPRKKTTARRVAAIVLLVLVGLAFAPPWWLSQRQSKLVGPAFVIDGDTIRINDERIRIVDVDAPEARQTCDRPDGTQWHCGEQAMLALSAWIGERIVICEIGERAATGEWPAQCSVDGTDVARWLASEGWAVPAPDCTCLLIRFASWRAKSDALGLWSSSSVMPWDWRNAN